MSYAIELDETVDDALRRIAAEQIEKALVACEGELHEAIHEVRKRCKKVRALLRLVREAEPDLYQRENARFRDLARTLSDLRDAHANLEALDDEGDALPPVARAQLHEELRELRDARVAQQDGHARLERAQSALPLALSDLAEWSVEATGWDALEGGLKKSYRRARHGYRDLGDDPSIEALHDWRKRGKYHRYHVKLLRRAWADLFETREDALHDLTDALGADQDVTRLAELAFAEGLASEHHPAIRRWARETSAAHRERARTLGARLFVEKPKALARRLHAHWSAA